MILVKFWFWSFWFFRTQRVCAKRRSLKSQSLPKFARMRHLTLSLSPVEAEREKKSASISVYQRLAFLPLLPSSFTLRCEKSALFYQKRNAARQNTMLPAFHRGETPCFSDGAATPLPTVAADAGRLILQNNPFDIGDGRDNQSLLTSAATETLAAGTFIALRQVC
jgi:hypothetical protein